MTDESALSAMFRYVLVRTSHPGNIGSAARAIRTMGFARMALVQPQRFPDPEATAIEQHVYEYREGSAGGYGALGGGCGCN